MPGHPSYKHIRPSLQMIPYLTHTHTLLVFCTISSSSSQDSPIVWVAIPEALRKRIARNLQLRYLQKINRIKAPRDARKELPYDFDKL